MTNTGNGRQEEKGTKEDERVEWHQQLNGREFEQALGDGERQASLAYYSPWSLSTGRDLATEQHMTDDVELCFMSLLAICTVDP